VRTDVTGSNRLDALPSDVAKQILRVSEITRLVRTTRTTIAPNEKTKKKKKKNPLSLWEEGGLIQKCRDAMRCAGRPYGSRRCEMHDHAEQAHARSRSLPTNCPAHAELVGAAKIHLDSGKSAPALSQRAARVPKAACGFRAAVGGEPRDDAMAFREG